MCGGWIYMVEPKNFVVSGGWARGKSFGHSFDCRVLSTFADSPIVYKSWSMDVLRPDNTPIRVSKTRIWVLSGLIMC